jgi:acyl-CoA thioester hydrolase
MLMPDSEPTMADVSPTHSIHRRVEREHIDLMGHANNTVFVKWMEECAVAHSDSAGWKEEAYTKLGAGWVVRRHEVVYTRPALLGARVRIETWVPEIKKATSRRCYRWSDAQTDEEFGRAVTIWAFVNIQSGRPVRIPEMVRSGFPIHPGAFDRV